MQSKSQCTTMQHVGLMQWNPEMKFYMHISNQTDKDFYAVIYQKDTFNSTAAIAWKVAAIPSQGGAAILDWEETFGLSVAQEEMDSAFTIGSVQTSAKLNQNYKVVKIGDFLKIDRDCDSSVILQLHQIIFTNKSGTAEAKIVSFLIDGKIAAVHKTVGEQKTCFPYKRSFSVGVFVDAVKPGSVISSIPIGPVQVNYSAQHNYAALVIHKSCNGYYISKPKMVGYHSNL